MKKIYMNPTMTIVKIQTTHMLAASADMYGLDATGAAMGREIDMEEELDELEDVEEEYDDYGDL
jgi:hypothetical protein